MRKSYCLECATPVKVREAESDVRRARHDGRGHEYPPRVAGDQRLTVNRAARRPALTGSGARPSRECSKRLTEKLAPATPSKLRRLSDGR